MNDVFKKDQSAEVELTPIDERMARLEHAKEELILEGVSPMDDPKGFLAKAMERAGWTEEEIEEGMRAVGVGLN